MKILCLYSEWIRDSSPHYFKVHAVKQKMDGWGYIPRTLYQPTLDHEPHKSRSQSYPTKKHQTNQSRRRRKSSWKITSKKTKAFLQLLFGCPSHKINNRFTRILIEITRNSCLALLFLLLMDFLAAKSVATDLVVFLVSFRWMLQDVRKRLLHNWVITPIYHI